MPPAELRRPARTAPHTGQRWCCMTSCGAARVSSAHTVAHDTYQIRCSVCVVVVLSSCAEGALRETGSAPSSKAVHAILAVWDAGGGSAACGFVVTPVVGRDSPLIPALNACKLQMQ
jgi:hypothetical protein